MERPLVEMVNLPAFGRPARPVWRKHWWSCPDPACLTGTWTEQEPRIAAARLALTDRAGRWVTFQVGKHGRTVDEVAQDLDCDWHPVNDAVIAYGSVLVDGEDRIGELEAQSRLESLGFHVNVIDDNSVIFGSVAGATFVVVSQSVSSSAVGDTFRDVSAPVWVTKP